MGGDVDSHGCLISARRQRTRQNAIEDMLRWDFLRVCRRRVSRFLEWGTYGECFWKAACVTPVRWKVLCIVPESGIILEKRPVDTGWNAHRYTCSSWNEQAGASWCESTQACARAWETGGCAVAVAPAEDSSEAALWSRGARCDGSGTISLLFAMPLGESAQAELELEVTAVSDPDSSLSLDGARLGEVFFSSQFKIL